MTDYAAVLAFHDSSKAYEALSKLNNSANGGVTGAAIVERHRDGRWQITDGSDAHTGDGFMGGSLIGMLVGVLGGPLGMLLGFTAGAAIGSAVDLDRAVDTGDVITEFAQTVRPGTNAVILQADDAGLALASQVAHELDGTVASRPLDEVLDELSAQQEAAAAAAEAARKELRDQRHKERKQKWEDRWDELKHKVAGDGSASGNSTQASN